MLVTGFETFVPATRGAVGRVLVPWAAGALVAAIFA
jgi:hypothetical protein